MADKIVYENYTSSEFKTGEELEAALKAAVSAEDLRGEAAKSAEAATAAKTAAESAVVEATAKAEGAAKSETNAKASETAAKAAQAAAEKARDEAQDISGGNFASTAYVDSKAAEAESNANAYTDDKVAGITVPVQSVNGKTGAVQLAATDVGALPLSGGAMTGELGIKQGGVGMQLGTSGNICATDTHNGGGTTRTILGAGIHWATDAAVEDEMTVGHPAFHLALRGTKTRPTYCAGSSKENNTELALLGDVPTKTSELTNDSGFLTSAPVASVNGKTGAVKLGASDVNALPLSGGTMEGTLYGNSGISLTANASSANNDQGITLNNSGNTGRISLGVSGGLGIYSDKTLFIRPAYSEGTGFGVKMTSSDMSPTTNASLSLGTSSSMQYNNIYGKTIYQNGKQVANKEDVPTTKETWTFTLEDGSTVTKAVYIG